MKKIQNIFAVLAMIFLIFAILLSSFQIVIYGDSQYSGYRRLYEKYHVTDELDMELDDVMKVTDHMMAYLSGEEEELSVITDVDGKNQDFFNEQDRLHMADVRKLFTGGLKLRNLLLVMTAVLILGLLFMKTKVSEVLPKAYAHALRVFSILTGIVVIGCAVDFTACFTLFHQMFFTNDLWLFDPAEDYMIRMLPEGFFLHMAFWIVICFAAGTAVLQAVMYGIRRYSGRRE